jgi:5-methylcytosine-specific restriction endonuclease McrA
MNDPHLPEALELDGRIAHLIQREQGAVVDVLLALAEFDRRRLYRELGHASLFDYLHRRRKLSRGAAHYRRVAAGLVERFPQIIEPLRDGRLCFTTVVVVAGVLTEENRAELLPRFFGLSKQEAQELAAEIRPREVVPARTVVTMSRVEIPAPMPAVAPKVHPGELDMPRREEARTLVEPMTATASRMHITVSRDFVALLKKAKAGQSHVQPNATDEDVLRAALELLIEKQQKRRASVPAKVKREVRKRDGGRCQWPTHDGGICGATVRLEIDHVEPRGQGGPSTVENCRVLCKAHNLEAAREAYGDDHMDLFTPSVPVAREALAEWAIGKAPSSLTFFRPRHILRAAASNPANGERHDDPDLECDRCQRVEITRLEGRLRGQRPRHRPRRLRDPDLRCPETSVGLAAPGVGFGDGVGERVAVMRGT